MMSCPRASKCREVNHKPGIRDKYLNHYPAVSAHYAGTIVLLGFFNGAGIEVFSFSSASLGVDVILTLRLGNLVLDSALEVDARRNALVTGGLVFAALPRAEGTPGGIGDEVRVPTVDVRKIFKGGPALTTGFLAVDGAALVRPAVEPTVARGPCFRFT